MPLALDDDLSVLSRALEGTELGPRTPMAPCLVEVRVDARTRYMRSVIVRGDQVYEVDGGVRRADGGFVICQSAAPAVYDLDARGRGTRWRIGFDGVATPEPADCRVTEQSVFCTASPVSFDGTIRGDLVVQREARRLGELRLIRFDRPPTDPCDLIVERAWKELAPTLAFLEFPSDEAAHHAYIREGYAFRGECAEATPEARGCLSAQRSVLRPAACALSPPAFVWAPHAPDPDRTTLPAAEAAARGRALIGTWTQDLGKYGERRWSFGADGSAREGDTTWTRYSVRRAGELVLETERSLVRMPFARDGKDRFYADAAVECPRQMAYATIALGGPDELVIRGSTCKTVTPYGELRDATCEPFEGDLEVTYVSWLGKAQKKLVRIVDGCYVRDEIEPYVRYR